MSLDDQLTEIFARLGVTMETEGDRAPERARTRGKRGTSGERAARGGDERQERKAMHDWLDDWGDDDAWDEVDETGESEEAAPAEASLFQTSREHYGVFYRLDLVSGAPQLRVFAPDEEGSLKMRCYLVRPAPAAPVREWFRATRAYEGSEAYTGGREIIEQHLLFAAGEALKRLFWAGEPEQMRFPEEITVRRVA